MTKKGNQSFALKLLLMTALNVHQDIRLADIEGEDRVSNKKLKQIIKILEE